jgi:class 3 adenylate cyclase/tetratricopeptide (TPR) repeat protein
MRGIADWLASIGLGEYAECFAENAIDISVLPDLTDQDLKDLGIKLGDRRKLLRAVSDLNRPAHAPAEAGGKLAPRGEAERRQLTIMFCDLVGSTALTARLDPEDMWQVIASYHECISHVVGRYGGKIARYMGDGVLIYFGYPQAREDDAVQAVRAALALLDAITNLRTNVEGGLQARIGLATGTVVVSELLIDEAPVEQATVGETPNLAARLQALAEPGTILICPRTRRLTGGHFNYRDLGPVALKGWAEVVPVWQVVGARDVESRFEAMHETKLPPLVGREEEIELLLRRWRHATQREGRVVLLTGEPGIGKSHIALTFEEQLQGEPHTTLRYFCSPHDTNSALFPFIAQLERAAGFERGDSPAQKLSKLRSLIAQSTADAEHVAVLANLFALPTSGQDKLQELSPQQRKEKTFSAFLSQIEGLAARQPLYMIFEDAHWIDPTSLELLSAVVQHVPQLKILMLVTARPEFALPWPSYPHMTTIPLTRLGQRDSEALIERVAGGKRLPKEVVDEILGRADGVPMFIEELTKTLLESGLLREREDHYVLEGPLPALAIPTTLHASLMARLDRLSPVREVAQIGAVVGREFHYELLHAVAGLPAQKLKEALNQLEHSELIFRRGEIPHAIYSFKHSLIRDAAYASLLKSRRGYLHGAIAKAMEQQFQDFAQLQPETLAHHLTEAGLIEKAIGYWLQAGKNAALHSANLEAIALLERGIEVIGRLPTGESRDKSELDFRLALGPCLIATHGPAASKTVSTFAGARELCERLGQPPEYLQVLFWLATVRVVRGELPQALEAIAGLPSAAQVRGNRAALINGIRGQGMILMFMGRIVEAGETLERAIEVFRASDEDDRLAARVAGQDAGVSMLVLKAWVLWLLGQVDDAVVCLADALQRADAVQHAHTHAYAWYYAAILHALRGEPAVARGYAERCLAISEQHEFRQWLGLSRAIRDICIFVLDRSTSQLDEAKASLQQYQSAGYQLGLTAQFVLLCPALLTCNETEAAQEVIEDGLSIVKHNSERFFEAELYRFKAHTLLRRGATEAEAEALLNQALRTARGQQARSLELRAATDLARYWLKQGKCTEALDVLSSIYGRFSQGFETRDLKEAKTVLGEIESHAPAAGRRQ